MKLTMHLIAVTCYALLCACNSKSDSNQKTINSSIKPGQWTLTMNTGTTVIPLRLYINEDYQFHIINGQEDINLGTAGIKKDSIYLEFPVYGTYFTGHINNDTTIQGTWHNPQRALDYTIPFKASFKTASIPQESDTGQKYEKRYAVRFSPDTENEYPAIGLFHQQGDVITGTFLTETGDYRFLEGQVNGESFWLSCFDGAHLFHFDGKGWGTEELKGNFYSGNHWKEPWEGELNQHASLRNADSLTFLTNPSYPFELNLMRIDGEFVHFKQQDFANKVTIIQILGTWCPNCLDESKYYKALYDQYGTKGLQIIPVAFERSSDFQTASLGVERYLTDLQLPYTAYIGGKASKQEANDAFPMLNHIMSFPTSIFIDKTGTVRKIHTGFYGPSTGEFYAQYTERIDLFIQQLIEEQNELTAVD